MSLPPYPAAFYAALHRGTDGDLAFYAEQCEGAASVLELGCGDGRVLAALDVPDRHGLDLHEGLLASARARLGEGVHLHTMDMRSFELTRAFDRIVLPFSGVYCLLSDDDLTACFSAVRRHLAPDGRFILDAYRADGFHAESEPEDVGDEDWAELGAIEVEGAPHSVFERSRWTPDDQRIDVTYRHISLMQPGAPVDGTIEQRYLLQHQLEGHLRDAGFGRVAVYGGFDGRPLSRASEHWAAVARP
jgi:SAM-dependent methyltransferase